MPPMPRLFRSRALLEGPSKVYHLNHIVNEIQSARK